MEIVMSDESVAFIIVLIDRFLFITITGFATIPGSDTKQLFGHLLFYALANFFVKLFNSFCILW
jgi:hypothetical protein